MRRFSVILMAASALLVIGTGIGEAFPSHTGLATHHIVAASLFLVGACIHGWYNRRAVAKYFSGLRWEWAVIAACPVVVVVVGSLFA
jgi:hypothetical protein